MTAMFDTLKFARALRDGGQFTPEQAERLSDVLSDAISGEVVNRADLAATETGLRKAVGDIRTELKADIAELRTELKTEIAELRTELKTEIAELRTELKAEIAELRAEFKADIAELRTELKADIAELRLEFRTDMKALEIKMEAAQATTIKWVVGLFGAQIVALLGGLIALARLLPK